MVIKRRRRPRTRPIDRNKSRCYKWENAHVNTVPGAAERIPEAELAAFAKRVWKELRTWHPEAPKDPPAIRVTHGRGGGYYRHDDYLISLKGAYATRKWLVLHELAHAVCSPYRRTEAAHGARFIATVIELYVIHCRASTDGLVEAARRMGLDFNAPVLPLKRLEAASPTERKTISVVELKELGFELMPPPPLKGETLPLF